MAWLLIIALGAWAIARSMRYVMACVAVKLVPKDKRLEALHSVADTFTNPKDPDPPRAPLNPLPTHDGSSKR